MEHQCQTRLSAVWRGEPEGSQRGAQKDCPPPESSAGTGDGTESMLGVGFRQRPPQAFLLQFAGQPFQAQVPLRRAWVHPPFDPAISW